MTPRKMLPLLDCSHWSKLSPLVTRKLYVGIKSCLDKICSIFDGECDRAIFFSRLLFGIFHAAIYETPRITDWKMKSDQFMIYRNLVNVIVLTALVASLPWNGIAKLVRIGGESLNSEHVLARKPSEFYRTTHFTFYSLRRRTRGSYAATNAIGTLCLFAPAVNYRERMPAKSHLIFLSFRFFSRFTRFHRVATDAHFFTTKLPRYLW